MLVGSGEHRCDIWAHGNHMAAYVNDMNAGWRAGIDAATSAQNMLNALASSFAPASVPQWIFLNEIYKDPGFWPDNASYRGWIINLAHALHDAGHNVIVAAQMRDSLGSDESWAWHTLSQYAGIGLEWYINSDHWQGAADPQQFLVNQYGNNKARYVAAGVDPSRLMFIEIYSTSNHGVTRGENGLPVADWRTFIARRLQAARSVGFAGYISYAWDYNQAGKSEAERLGDMDVYDGAF
jgi:hypothetical protein